MSIARLPKNNLVIFTPNNGHGHLGIICEVNNDTVRVYSFLHTKTFMVPADRCIAFRYPDDYETMCREGYWTGVIVQSPTGRHFTAHGGRLDLVWQDCELNLQLSSGPDIKPLWVPLKHVTPIGHTSA